MPFMPCVRAAKPLYRSHSLSPAVPKMNILAHRPSLNPNTRTSPPSLTSSTTRELTPNRLHIINRTSLYCTRPLSTRARITMAISLQDRTSEFHTLTTAVSKKLKARTNAHQRLLAEDPSRPKNPRGEFARRAADIGRAITDTMGKLERLAMRAPPSWPALCGD
jgi:hypothetical protein